MAKAYWTITPFGLKPEDDDAKQWHATARKNGRSLCQIQQPSLPRNPKFHRKFFALVKVVYDTLPENYDKRCLTVEDFRKELIKAVGYTRPVLDIQTGQIKDEADSIAWHKMDEAKFDALFNLCADWIIKNVWPGIAKETLKAEVAEMCGAGGLSEIDRMPDGQN